jgi:hypothetical protein
MATPHRVELRSVQLEQKLADTTYDADLGTLSTSYTTIATGMFEVFLDADEKIELSLTAEIGPDDAQSVARLKGHFHAFSQALVEATRDWAQAPAK